MKIYNLLIASLWITFSEFVRNEILFKNYWIHHYDTLGLTFQTTPINGILWTLWSFCFAYIIGELVIKFSLIKAFIISWLAGFFMMWITLFNLQVLPISLLIFAIPLSILEIYICICIFKIVKY